MFFVEVIQQAAETHPKLKNYPLHTVGKFVSTCAVFTNINQYVICMQRSRRGFKPVDDRRGSKCGILVLHQRVFNQSHNPCKDEDEIKMENNVNIKSYFILTLFYIGRCSLII